MSTGGYPPSRVAMRWRRGFAANLAALVAWEFKIAAIEENEQQAANVVALRSA